MNINMNNFNHTDSREDIAEYLNDTLVLGGLFKNSVYKLMNIFSITDYKKLRDFVPVAAYAKKIIIPKTKPDLYKKYPYGIFRAWLVLERNGTYYVSHINMKDVLLSKYNYDFMENLKRWEDNTYPTEVYDFIKDVVTKKLKNISYIDYMKGKSKQLSRNV